MILTSKDLITSPNVLDYFLQKVYIDIQLYSRWTICDTSPVMDWVSFPYLGALFKNVSNPTTPPKY